MVKAFVGDPYLTGIAIKNEISEEVRTNALTFKESGSFGYEELSFMSSMGIFGTNTLVFKTDKLEANDDLLTLLSCNFSNNLYIVTETLVKGRKLYNRLKELNCIKEFNVDTRCFRSLIQNEAAKNNIKISLELQDYIAKRCGFNEKDVSISAFDIVSWVDRLAISGEVTKESIDRIVPKYTPDNVFLLKDSLMHGRADKVMEIADAILISKGSVIGALSAVLIDFRIALKLSYFSDNATLRARALKEMNIPAFKIPKCNYTPKQLGKCFDRVCKGISRCKSGYLQDVEFKNTLADCLLYLKN